MLKQHDISSVVPNKDADGVANGADPQILQHYENMSVQYEAIFKSGKNDIFRCINVTFFLFLLKT